MRFDKGIEANKVDVVPGDRRAQRTFEAADLLRARRRLFNQLHPLRGGEEQPALDVLQLDPVMQHRGHDAAPQFVAIILQRDQQHAPPAEYMLAGQRAARGKRQQLRDPQRRLAYCALGQYPGQKAPAEAVAEQPAARRDRRVILPRVPFAERCRMLTVAADGLPILGAQRSGVVLDLGAGPNAVRRHARCSADGAALD